MLLPLLLCLLIFNRDAEALRLKQKVRNKPDETRMLRVDDRNLLTPFFHGSFIANIRLPTIASIRSLHCLPLADLILTLSPSGTLPTQFLHDDTDRTSNPSQIEP